MNYFHLMRDGKALQNKRTLPEWRTECSSHRYEVVKESDVGSSTKPRCMKETLGMDKVRTGKILKTG